ncbi:hypothetical protein MKX03_034280 [Papaver bracteatum]|nr:hypothetical protein MKX03_034280 [Papaver bracteatum]
MSTSTVRSSNLANLHQRFCRYVCKLFEACNVLEIAGVPEEVKLTSNCSSPKSTKQVDIDVEKYCQNNESTRPTVENFRSGNDSFHADGQCRDPQCWCLLLIGMNKSKDRFVEVLLMVCSFLLSFANAGAFYFLQALTNVGSHDDPVLKRSLAALNRVFVASFLCNFLGVFVLLILQSRRGYHLYKKFSLVISNAASFLLMVLGYGLLIAFNIGRR